MKSELVSCAVFCALCAVCWGQWLEATIPVGDYPEALCCNSVNNKVYCANNGSNAVTVIDGGTNAAIGEVEVGFEPCGLCYNSAADKVYCSYWNDGFVTVISGAGDTAITHIPMQVCHGFMCCDSTGNKVYCAGDTGDVTVICGAGDSVLRVIHAGKEAAATSMTCSPHHRKAFCGFDFWSAPDTVFIIDCRSDSIIAAVPVSDWPSSQCYNPTNDCVYCGADYDWTMTVIVCATNQAVAWLDLGYGQSSACCAPPESKVFCTTYDGRLLVIDAGSNAVVDSLETGYCQKSFYNYLNHKVYLASWYDDSAVTVIDAATHEVLCTIGVGVGPIDFCHNPVQNRVYVANYMSSSVSVIRDSAGGVEETMNDARGTMNTRATIVRGVLFLLPSHLTLHPSLFSLSGQKVMSLRPGANDVSGLAPGVYFVREGGMRTQAQTIRRVVVMK